MPFWSKKKQSDSQPQSETTPLFAPDPEPTITPFQATTLHPDPKPITSSTNPEETPTAHISPASTELESTIEPIHQEYSGKTWTVSTVEGEADFTSISAAIEQASDWDTIEVQNGVYTERLSVSKPLHIRGEGSPKAVQPPSNSSTVLLIGSHQPDIAIVTWTAKGGSLTNLLAIRSADPSEDGTPQYAGTGLDVTCGELELSEAGFEGDTEWSIRVSDSSRLVMSNVYTTPETISGISVGIGCQVALANCTINSLEENPTAPLSFPGVNVHGIHTEPEATIHLRNSTIFRSLKLDTSIAVLESTEIGGDASIRGATKVGIDHCTFEGTLSAYRGANPQITNCVLRGAGFSMGAVSISENGSATLQSCQIAGGSMLDNHLVKVTGADGVSSLTLVDCTIVGMSGHGVVCEAGGIVTIRNSLFSSNTSNCIVVKGGIGTISSSKFVDNDTPGAVVILDGGSLTMSETTITGTTGIGIGIETGSTARVNRNHFIGNGYGVVVQSNSSATLTGNTFQGNNEGVRTTASSVADIHNNEFIKNLTYGAVFTHQGKGTMRSNVFVGNGQHLGIAESSDHLFNLAEVMRENQFTLN